LPVTQDVTLNLLASSPVLKQENLNVACLQKNKLRAVQGRAVYPRYYEANDGETFTDSAGYKAVYEGRLVFQMLGPIDARVIFPMSEPPGFFPNASDATLFFDAGGNIRLVFVEQDGKQGLYFSENFPPIVCD